MNTYDSVPYAPCDWSCEQLLFISNDQQQKCSPGRLAKLYLDTF